MPDPVPAPVPFCRTGSGTGLRPIRDKFDKSYLQQCASRYGGRYGFTPDPRQTDKNGKIPPKKNVLGPKTGSKNGNIFDTYGTPITNSFPLNKYLLVPRGHCTFEAKARSAQRLGATGVIIYNTLESRYGIIDKNKGSDSNSWDDYYGQPKNVPDFGNTIWPRNRIDYECGTSASGNKGEYHPHKAGIRAEIPVNQLDFDAAPYDA